MKIDRKKYRIKPVGKTVNVYMTLTKSFMSIDYVDTKKPVASVYINVEDDLLKQLKRAKKHLSVRGVKGFLGEYTNFCFAHMWERL